MTDARSFWSRPVLLLPLAYMLASAGLAYRLGQDINWDLRNYHLYAPYLALEDRLDTDVHAAGVQTFLNPVLDLPLYFAVREAVPPIAFGLTLAAFQGLALWCVHRIARSVVPGTPWWFGHAAGLLAASAGAFGAAFYAELGTTMGDAVIAILVLVPVAMLLARASSIDVRASILVGGLLGLAVGAKPSAGIYGPGLLCMLWMAAASRRERVLGTVAFGLAAAAGLIIAGGYWMWLMQDRFGSPLFPFYNLAFRSQWAPLRDFAGEIYGALRRSHTMFSLPFAFVTTQMVAAETPFRDARLAVGAIAALTVLFVAIARLMMGTGLDGHASWKRLVMTTVFWVASYIAWSRSVTLYRFAIVLELLSAVLVIGVIAHTIRHRATQVLAATAICGALVWWAKPPDFGRIGWQPDYFGVSRSDFAEFSGATVVLADFPTAWVVPFFPESATFVRVVSNWPLELDGLMAQRAQLRLQSAPPDRLYMLAVSDTGYTPLTVAALERLGFAVDASACRRFQTLVDRLTLCRLARPPASPAAAK